MLRPRSFCKLALGLGLLAAGATVHGSTNYVAAGTEYAIAGSQAGDQVLPRLSLGPNGGLLVWQDNVTDGSGLGIGALRLNSTFAPTMSRFRVNQQSVSDQAAPEASLLKDDGAVVVWQGGVQGFQRIYARFFTPANAPLTGDILVNTFTNGSQRWPVVATLASGNVVVVWASYDQAAVGSMHDIYAQVLSPTGAKVGGEFRVNQFTANNQRTPTVAALANGQFVVGWISEGQRFTEVVDQNTGVVTGTTSVDVYGRLFNAGGSAVGNEFLVNSASIPCSNPRVTATSSGDFAVIWAENNPAVRTNGWDIRARVFTSAGVGGTVRSVNTQQYGDQILPSISSAGSDYLAVWTSLGQDGSREGVYGQFLTSQGTALGAEFRVNTTTVSQQLHPTVSSDSVRRFLVAWTSFAGGAESFELESQAYLNMSEALEPLAAPFVRAPFVLSGGSYQPQLDVSWVTANGWPVDAYEVYVDSAVTPSATVASNRWLMTAAQGLAANSTHSFKVAYVLTDGRRSPLSASASGKTWSGLSYYGMPYEWMVEHWQMEIANWPRATDDLDHDGLTTLQEFLASTDPKSDSSTLRSALRRTGQGVFLDWGTVPGRFYQVQSTPTLTPPAWVNVGAPRFAAGAVDTVFLGGSSGMYFRILLVP